MLRPILIAFSCLLSVALFSATTSAKNAPLARHSLSSIGNCARKTVISFYDQDSFPPTTSERMRQYCKGQADGIKCLRERSKSTSGIVRRGLSTFVSGRQRYHKRLCNNVDSDHTRQWMEDFKCIMDKKFGSFQALEKKIIYIGGELVRRNYNDSSAELKHICCSLLDFRRAMVKACEPECSASKATVEDMIQQSMSNELSLVCDDDDKLASKICPALEPIKLADNLANQTYEAPAQTFLYLMATLGEPDKTLS